MNELSTLLEEARSVLQLVLIDETGDSYYRMRWPGQQIANQAPNWRVISLDARAEERFQLGLEADLLIIYQSNDIDLLPLIAARRAQGKKTLAEYNDNFYDPPPASPVYKPWTSPLIWQSYERIMAECDGVVVTGPGLKKLFSKSVSNEIHILENHLPFSPPPYGETWKEIEGQVNLAWAGSLGHIADVVSTLPTIRKLIDEHKNLHFNIMGNEALPGLLGIPEARFSYKNWGSMKDYHEFWQPIHLGFAPLLDTPYNECRSDIKAVEMASHAVLPVLQDALPYKEFIKKTDAPHYKTLEELHEILQRFISSPELIKDATQRCYEYVAEERVGVDRKERLELYAAMCSAPVTSTEWKIPVGYHELQGKTNAQLRFTAVLREAQALADQKKPADSLQVIRNALSQNPFTPELALAELNTLRAMKSAELFLRLDHYIEQFPRDWRFMLFRLVVAAPEKKLSYWEELLRTLSKAPQAAVDFYHADVVKLFVRHLARFAELHAVGLKLLKLLPHSAELRLQMAISSERQGDFKDALAHFSWLLEEKESTERNAKYLAGLEFSFLKTWESALEARIKKPSTTKKTKEKAKPSSTKKKKSTASKKKKSSAKKKD